MKLQEIITGKHILIILIFFFPYYTYGSKICDMEKLDSCSRLKDSSFNQIYEIYELDSPPHLKDSSSLMVFIEKKLKYPQEDIVGTIIVHFVVSKKGKIKEEKLVSEIPNCQKCSQYAIDVVRKIPQLIPGKKNGKNVATRVFLPIRFDCCGIMKNKNEWKFDFPVAPAAVQILSRG